MGDVALNRRQQSMAKLEINAKGRKSVVALNRSSIAIGRDSTNDVVLADTKASRQHCRIDCHEGEFRVTDLNSHNGTWIGHERIQERMLRSGESIRIGGTFISLLSDTPIIETDDLVIIEEEDAPPPPKRPSRKPAKKALESFDEDLVTADDRATRPSPFLFDFGGKSKPTSITEDAQDIMLLDPRREPVLLPVDTDPLLQAAVQDLRALVWSATWADASGIHIEPQHSKYSIRFRIDGVLHTVGEVPIRDARCVVEAIRRLCELEPRPEKVAETGLFVVETAGEHFTEYRSHFVSTGLGQRAVLTRMDAAKANVPMESLGLDLDSVATITKQVERQKGLILFTGPSASGKTTTAYCVAAAIDPASRSVAIVEETREYPLPAAIRLTADALGGKRVGELAREAVLQDSDALLVGNLSDRDGATVALEAAINGRLVLATMDAPGIEAALTRLLGWGVEPFLVAHALEIMTSQRLVRVLCPDCRRSYQPETALLEKRGMADRPHGAFYEAVGCNKCLKTGFCWRTGVYDLLRSGTELRDVIVGCPSVSELRRSIAAHTIQTLSDSANKKVIEGVTTLAEIDRVVHLV